MLTEEKKMFQSSVVFSFLLQALLDHLRYVAEVFQYHVGNDNVRNI